MKHRFFILILLSLVAASGLLHQRAGTARCEDTPGNRLANETSPYLLKHAANPVKWYPWGEEPFAKAREQDKPIFLSIGYLTCHWCNVMEEESFSDPEVAALINEVFIPVKVDREERPDIDQIYMKACHLLSSSCGWPLTLFLSPAGKPFYAATYIPRENRFGRPGLLELLPRVKELWARERDSLLKSADSINAAMIASTIQLPGAQMDVTGLDAAFQTYAENFDPEYGGFGTGNKFPKPLNLLFLLRYWHRTGNMVALEMVEKTLAAIRRGAIYDHLGYGLHRYATDPMWRLPHFEKMLYDQALLVIASLEAYQATGKKEYGDTAREILTYVLRDLAAPEGGFYSAESADSEGEEGKFYLWSKDEINDVLGPQNAKLAINLFNITEAGNYIDPVTGNRTGRNTVYIDMDADKTAAPDNVRDKLFAARNTRPRPVRDDKVLTDWNGLMIAALARGAQVLDEKEYGVAAQRGARFILDNLRNDRQELVHRWRRGRAGLPATAADYSFMIWGLLEIYGWDFDPRWLQQALELTGHLESNYWDYKLGGFYLTKPDENSRLPKIKEIIDTAVPSSNAVAMYNLLRLSRLTGKQKFAEKAARINSLLSSRIKDSPLAFPMLLAVLELGLAPSQEVVITGKPGHDDTEKMIKALRSGYFPHAVTLFKPAGEKDPSITRYAGFTEYMNPIKGKATAYVCTNFKCNFPTTDPATMLDSLRTITAKPPEE